ncbi:MAG: hypothetical protein J6Z82_07450 [Schwartzia sp.]|nr:hypothetical protein [Schwartzia sp. (in: firmicutes)]
MKRGAYILLLAAVLLMAFGTAAFAAEGEQHAPPLQPQARQTKRVAMIPLIDNTGGWLTRRAAERLMNRMDRELHIPLNDSMHWVEFLNEDEATEAFREALKAQGKKARPELAARDAAKALDADLVLLLVVEQFYQRILPSFGWDWETYIESSARLVVYGYDARHDRLIKAPGWRFERTTYHPSYEAEELAAEALDEALGEARPKDAIFPLTENNNQEGKNIK